MTTMTFAILGVPVTAHSKEDALARIQGWVTDRDRSRYVCVTGVHGLVEASSDAQLRHIHQTADLVVPDGRPVVWIGRALGVPVSPVRGIDLTEALLHDAERTGLSVFFYGSSSGTLSSIRINLAASHPDLKVAGFLSPPFRPLTNEERSDIVATISVAKPDLILVGLSTPKQERWMYEMAAYLQPVVMLGVGAVFDFLAGTKKPAPRWMHKVGCEWLFRLVTEPRRLGPRYARSIPLFLIRVLRERPSRVSLTASL